MHFSNLGFNVRQRNLDESRQDVANETRPETKGDLVQFNPNTKNVRVVGTEVSQFNSKNVLSRDIKITGSITLTEELFFDGRMDGEINTTGALTVGENAEIIGQIKVGSARIFGKIEGRITAADYCELKAQSVLEGDLKASRLVMEEGASFVGNSKIMPSRVLVQLPQAINSVEKQNADHKG